MKLVEYIVVSYKASDKKLLSLQKLSKNIEFIDNSNSINLVKSSENLNFISNKENLGYGGGANVGIKNSLSEGFEWFVILNQDLEISKNSLSLFEEHLKNSKPGIVGVFPGKLDENRWTTIIPSTETDYISGAFIAIHKDVVRKIGYFYEPYFMYYEDVDYCLRAKESGFPISKISLEGIKHEESPSLGKGSFMHEYYLSRNHMLFLQRQAPLKVKLKEYMRLPLTCYEYVQNQNKGALEGLKDYFMGRFGEKKL